MRITFTSSNGKRVLSLPDGDAIDSLSPKRPIAELVAEIEKLNKTPGYFYDSVNFTLNSYIAVSIPLGYRYRSDSKNELMEGLIALKEKHISDYITKELDLGTHVFLYADNFFRYGPPSVIFQEAIRSGISISQDVEGTIVTRRNSVSHSVEVGIVGKDHGGLTRYSKAIMLAIALAIGYDGEIDCLRERILGNGEE